MRFTNAILSHEIEPIPYSIVRKFHESEKADIEALSAMEELAAFAASNPGDGSNHPDWPADAYTFLLGRIQAFARPLGYKYHESVFESFRRLDRYEREGRISNAAGEEARALLKEWHGRKIDIEG